VTADAAMDVATFAAVVSVVAGSIGS